MKRQRVIGFLLSLTLGLLVQSVSAWSAEYATKTAVDHVELKAKPKEESKTLQTLTKGMALTSTDDPVDGFYKFRIGKVVGWIHQSFLESPEAIAKAEADKLKEKRFQIDAHTSYNMFEIADLNNAIQSKAFSGGLSIGGGALWRWRPEWGFGARAEWISMGKIATDASTGNKNDLSVTSLMFMARVQRIIMEKGPFTLGVSGYVGMATPKFVLVVAGDSVAPPVGSRFMKTMLMEQVMVEGSYAYRPYLGGFVEAGYRLASTGALPPTNLGNGAAFLPATVDLGMSGVVISGGAYFKF